MIAIKRNDIVKILAGKDKGKTGKVIMVFPRKDRALVEGVNYVKKHTKQTQQNQKGGIIQKEMPIQFSNLMLMCKNCNKPTRVEINITADGKARICKKCKEIIA